MAVNASLDKPGVVLEAKGISKSFPGVKALDDVSLSLRRGRVHALLGENGAGKSTLMNVLAGVLQPDAGEILVDGRAMVFRNPREASDAGISVIHQELNLIPHLTVAQNIFLGREPMTRAGLIDDAEMNRQAIEWLKKLRLDVSPWALVAGLRVGQQQVVEIAKALSTRANVIIMDEPTSAVTEHEVEALHDLIRRLRDEGTAIVYITHKLDELPLIADEFTVMRDGCRVGGKSAAAVDREEIVRMMVGRNFTVRSTHSGKQPGRDGGSPAELLRVESMHLEHPERAGDFAVKDVSLELRRGEILGIFGLMGAGRTELLECVFGLHAKRAQGKVFVEGSEVRFRNAGEAIEAGVVLAPEDRKHEGLVMEMSIAENTSMACIGQTERFGFLSRGKEDAMADRLARRLRTKTPSVRQLARNLSGGNQQKVVLAKWLATKPKVLLLDEPTRGIDINAKEEIYTLMDELAAEGLGVVMVSSELPEILAVADRILVMSEGRKTAEFSRGEADEERIMHAALPRN